MTKFKHFMLYLHLRLLYQPKRCLYKKSNITKDFSCPSGREISELLETARFAGTS